MMGKGLKQWVVIVAVGAWLPVANALAAAPDVGVSEGYVAASGAVPAAQRLVLAGFTVQETGGALGIDLPLALPANGASSGHNAPAPQPESRLEFLDKAIQLSVHPATLIPGKQYQAVNHPLLSHVFAYQYTPDTVRVRLLTRQFDGSRLEGAVSVQRTATGLLLVVGAPLVAAPSEESPVVAAASETGAADADHTAALPVPLPDRQTPAVTGKDGGVRTYVVQGIAGLLGATVLLWLGGAVRRRLVGWWSSPCGNLSLISQVEVGAGQHIALLEADGRRLVVGLEADGMRLLADLGEVAAPQGVAEPRHGLSGGRADNPVEELAEEMVEGWTVLPSDAATVCATPVPVTYFGFADAPCEALSRHPGAERGNRWLAAS